MDLFPARLLSLKIPAFQEVVKKQQAHIQGASKGNPGWSRSISDQLDCRKIASDWRLGRKTIRREKAHRFIEMDSHCLAGPFDVTGFDLIEDGFMHHLHLI